MHVNLGQCHYGCNDAATMTAVHPKRTGWIPVCVAHADEAEQDGYRVRQTEGHVGTQSSEFADPHPRPTFASPAEDLNNAREVTRTPDLDLLDAMLDDPGFDMS